MDSAKLNDWMQVFGIFALVGSLIFVGLQMKQDQDIAIATQYQARAVTAIDIQEARQQSGIVSRQEGQRYIDLYGLPEGIDEDISAEDFGALIFDARRLIYVYDNLHFQHSSGFLSEDAWQTNRAQIRSMARRPIFYYLFENVPGKYRDPYLDVWYGRDTDSHAKPE
jgi:hypothetical protein